MLLKKIDRRFNGYSLFSHVVVFKMHWRQTTSTAQASVRQLYSEIDEFLEMRNNLWTNFGPGLEEELFAHCEQSISPLYLKLESPVWGWRSKQSPRSAQLYLRDAALTHVLLVYPIERE